jgi:hypothetical protein
LDAHRESEQRLSSPRPADSGSIYTIGRRLGLKKPVLSADQIRQIREQDRRREQALALDFEKHTAIVRDRMSKGIKLTPPAGDTANVREASDPDHSNKEPPSRESDLHRFLGRTWRDGEFGNILFTPEDSLAEALKKMEVPVRIDYDDGFMRVGMGNAYTIRMLYEEFKSLTHETWEFGPTLPIRREIDGTVVHGISWEWSELSALINADKEVQHPPKVIEERGRGMLIRSLKSQGKLLQYWARSESNMEVGIFLPAEVNGKP